MTTERESKRKPLAEQINLAMTFEEKWPAITAYYAEAIKDIMAAPANCPAIPKYEVNWDIFFTPIERIIAHEAAYLATVLYPQFPIGPFFVDFANPKAKVVVECDGVQFHEPVKDMNRDRVLTKMGWHVYRFTGSDCHHIDRQEDGRLLEYYDPYKPSRDFAPSLAACRFRQMAVKHRITRRPSIIHDYPKLAVGMEPR